MPQNTNKEPWTWHWRDYVAIIYLSIVSLVILSALLSKLGIVNLWKQEPYSLASSSQQSERPTRAARPYFDNKSCLDYGQIRLREQDPLISDEDLIDQVSWDCVRARQEWEASH